MILDVTSKNYYKKDLRTSEYNIFLIKITLRVSFSIMIKLAFWYKQWMKYASLENIIISILNIK